MLFPLIMLAIYWLSGYYNDPLTKSRLQEFSVTLGSSLLNSLWMFLVVLANDTSESLGMNMLLLASVWFVLFVFTYSGRYVLTVYRRRMIVSGRWRHKVVVLGREQDVKAMSERLKKKWFGLGFDVVGVIFIDDNANMIIPQAHDTDVLNIPILDYKELGRMCSNKQVQQVLIASNGLAEENTMKILKQLFPMNVSVKIQPDVISLLTSGVYLHDIYGEPFVDLTMPRMGAGARNVKRVFDVAVSTIALVLVSPLLAWLAIRVKRSSPGNVFYCQERIGRHGKSFKIIKFRTMVTDAEASGPQLSCNGDKRITTDGAWMRKYRLDELPQFWNVLKGDMSLVGPRPEREYYIRQILAEAPYYTLILQVKPGITSWGMVKYGYASSVEQMIERTHYDLLYLQNMSLMLDMKILIHTVNTVLSGKGK